MRQYIFNFSQAFLISNNLKLNEALVLDYMHTFFNSQKAKSKVIDGKTYYFLTLKKILDDLPILNIKEKQLKNIIQKLLLIHLLEKKSNNKNFYRIIYDNIEEESFINHSNNTEPNKDKKVEKFFQKTGNKFPQIDNYNNKKNNIYINELKIPRANTINLPKLNLIFQALLQKHFSPITYKLYFNELVIVSVTHNSLILSASNVERINNTFLSDVLKILKQTMKEYNNNLINF